MADTGKILPLVSGGGGSGVVFGDPATGFLPGMIQYIDQSGNQYGDINATRISSGQFETRISSLTYAQAGDDSGPGTEFLIQANVLGSNPIITFDGVNDTDTNVSAYNLANPGDTISVLSGGTNTPVADTYQLVGGGPTTFETGVFNGIGLPLQASGFSSVDNVTGAIALNFVGNITPIAGGSSFVSAIGNFGPNLAVGLFNQQAIQLFLTDSTTFSSNLNIDDVSVSITHNQYGFGIDSLSSGYAFADGLNNFIIPFGQTPSIGDVLQITNIAGSDYTVEYAPISTSGIPNGNKPFQLWNWNDNAATQDWYQVFILTQDNLGDSNVLIGQDAGQLSETGYVGYANTIIGTSAAKNLAGTPAEVSRNVVVGMNAIPALNLMQQSVVIGYQAYLGGTDQIINSILISPDNSGQIQGSPITDSILIGGSNAKVHGINNIVVGYGASPGISSSSSDTIIIGATAATSVATTNKDVIIGSGAGAGYTAGTHNIFLGYGTSASGIINDSIALGTNAQVTNDNQLVIGGIAGTSASGAIYNVKFNNGVTDTSGQIYEFKYTDVLTSVTDGDGSNVMMYAGTGTGAGQGSKWNFLTSIPTTSGTSSHSNFKALTLSGLTATMGDVDGISNGNKLIVNNDSNFIYAITGDKFDVFSTLNKRYLRIDYGNRYSALGDVDDVDNGTRLFIDDAGLTATVFTDGFFSVKDTLGNLLLDVDSAGKSVILGDASLVGNQNYIQVSDSSNDARVVLGNSAAFVIRGGTGGGAHVMLGAEVTESRIYINDTRFQEDKGANVSAANDLTLGGDGNVFTITGNTTINAITTTNWRAGSQIILIFSGSPTVKHNTSGGANTAVMFLAGSADISASANTVLGLVYDGTQWQEMFRKVP